MTELRPILGVVKANETGLPSELSPVERILWLAYCSGDFLRTNGPVPSFASLRGFQGSNAPYTFEAVLGGNLPLRFQQQEPGFIRADGGTRTVPLPEAFKNNYTAFEYEAVSVTNVATLTIPSSLLARYFLVSHGVRWNSCTYTSWVTSASVATPPFELPAITAPAHIHDLRFTNERGTTLSYEEKPGASWLERKRARSLRLDH